MSEKLNFAGTAYAAQDFKNGLDWVIEELIGLGQDVNLSGQVGEIAAEIIPEYQGAVEWARTRPPEEILSLWKQITDRVKDSGGVDSPQIGQIIFDEFGDVFGHIRVLLRNKRGPHKTLGQKVSAYLMDKE